MEKSYVQRSNYDPCIYQWWKCHKCDLELPEVIYDRTPKAKLAGKNMNLGELLLELHDKMEGGCCYGIRLNRKNEVMIFYHPWGCESEWSCKPDGREDLYKRVDEWRER